MNHSHSSVLRSYLREDSTPNCLPQDTANKLLAKVEQWKKNVKAEAEQAQEDEISAVQQRGLSLDIASDAYFGDTLRGLIAKSYNVTLTAWSNTLLMLLAQADIFKRCLENPCDWCQKTIDEAYLEPEAALNQEAQDGVFDFENWLDRPETGLYSLGNFFSSTLFKTLLAATITIIGDLILRRLGTTIPFTPDPAFVQGIIRQQLTAIGAESQLTAEAQTNSTPQILTAEELANSSTGQALVNQGVDLTMASLQSQHKTA